MSVPSISKDSNQTLLSSHQRPAPAAIVSSEVWWKFEISFRNWNENKLFLGDLTYFTTWIGNRTIRHWFSSVKFSVIVLDIFCDHTKLYRSRFLNCISDMISIRQIFHQSINRESTRQLFYTQHRRQKRCCMRYMSSNNDDSEHQERHLPSLMNYSVRPSPNFLHTFKNFIFANVRIISDWLNLWLIICKLIV